MYKPLFIMLTLLNFHLSAQDPPDISLTFYIEEFSPNGTVVGTVTGTDPNGDPLIYSIVSGNGSGTFDINSTTGDVFVADESQMNFDLNPSFVIGVAADDGNGGVTSVEITINLIDIPLGFRNEIELKVYPNPVTDKLFVDLTEVKVGDFEVVLYSISGDLQPAIPIVHSSGMLEIGCEHLTPGMYLLSISCNETLIKKRIIVK